MKNKIILILIFSILIIGLNPVCGVDSSNWKEITIDGIDFKIPPQYEGGKLYGENNNYSKYILDTVFNFSIASLSTDSQLKQVYGYESTIEELTNIESKRVGNHDLVILYSNRSVCQHEVVYLFYAIGNKIFAISYNGNSITPEIKEIIKNTPKSKISKEKFYNKLYKAQISYINEQNDYNEAYEYNQYTNLKSNNQHHYSFADYYIAYRITNHLMK